MKKIRILSVLLAVLMALTCVSAVTTSAALFKSISSIEIASVPDDIYTKTPEEMLYGVQIKVNYTDSSSKTFKVSADNVEYEYSNDYIDSHASSQSNVEISLGLTSSVSIDAYNYVGDYIQLYATAYNNYSYDDNSFEAELKLDYPEDYELPELFCKDDLVYRNNPDNTLTLVNHSYAPYLYYYMEDDYIAPPVVIPETINGKTVTAVADYALLGTTHPSLVTVPKTVTSIGDYAFGFCFDPNSYGDNHDVPDNVSVSRLLNKLAEAEDDETFLVDIIFYVEDCKPLSDKLQAEYLSDCADYEYDDEMGIAYATLTKAQIYSMQDVEDIMIELLYERDSYLSEEIYDFAEYAGNDAEMCVEFEVYADTDEELASLCEELSKKYFGGRTDYTVNYEFYEMRVNATFNEIKAAVEEDLVGYTRFYGAGEIYYDLYKALYFEDDNFTTDIFVVDYSEEHLTENFIEYAAKYFADCEYDIFSFEGQETLIIKCATKQQIFNAGQDTNFGIDLFDYPLINRYDDLVIYGENGSTAQTYAENNSIKFVTTGSEYQLGDVNLDGKITVADATMILKANVDLVTLTDEQKKLADFDGNGVVNVIDASELQRAIVNS
ncbi:MAG: dockerin type I repeat-containing protein [Ruminococcus sp.]